MNKKRVLGNKCGSGLSPYKLLGIKKKPVRKQKKKRR